MVPLEKGRSSLPSGAPRSLPRGLQGVKWEDLERVLSSAWKSGVEPGKSRAEAKLGLLGGRELSQTVNGAQHWRILRRPEAIVRARPTPCPRSLADFAEPPAAPASAQQYSGWGR
jgi:hypothetical protein